VLGDVDGDLAVEAASSLAAEAAHQGDHLGLGVDVRDEGSCIRFLNEVENRLGPVEVLVNCAGVAIPGEFLAGSAAGQNLEIDVNLRGVVRLMRLVLPAMVDRGSGHIVNMASAAGRIAAPRAAVYGATKQAVVAVTEAVRWEVQDRGVRVSAVLPAVVSTEMAAGLRTPGLPRVSPDAVAAAVLRVLRSPRPPAVSMVPRWLLAISRVDAVSPQWLRDRARRLIRVEEVPDDHDRARYQARVARQWEAVQRSADSQQDEQ
jgi:short-subunit dehydrogenase